MILERTIPTGYVDPHALSDAKLAELVWAARWDSDIPNEQTRRWLEIAEAELESRTMVPVDLDGEE